MTQNHIFILLLLSFYLLFMFKHFKTTRSIHHPLESIIQNRVGDFFRHPFYDTTYNNKICPFGQTAIKYLVVYLWIRLALRNYLKINTIKNISKCIVVMTFIVSLMNFNATIYLIPYFVYEYYFIC